MRADVVERLYGDFVVFCKTVKTVAAWRCFPSWMKLFRKHCCLQRQATLRNA